MPKFGLHEPLSPGWLARLPLDTLKVDRSSVLDMSTAPDGPARVSGSIRLAHSLELRVVAQGVETGEQSRLQRRLSCDAMQDYSFSLALPAKIFDEAFFGAAARRVTNNDELADHGSVRALTTRLVQERIRW